jgi:hypothetical protein
VAGQDWLDDLARGLANGRSRRSMLRTLGAGLAGAMLAHLSSRSVEAQQAPTCADQGQSCDRRRCCQGLSCVTAGANKVCCPNSQVCGRTCCPPGSRCVISGGRPRCVCDAISCPTGCCQGGTNGTCTAQSASACGTNGVTCTICTETSGTCVGGVCKCGSGPACLEGQTCVGGTCIPNNEICEPGTAFKCIICGGTPAETRCGGPGATGSHGEIPYCLCVSTTEGGTRCGNNIFCPSDDPTRAPCSQTSECVARFGMGFFCSPNTCCGGGPECPPGTCCRGVCVPPCGKAFPA